MTNKNILLAYIVFATLGLYIFQKNKPPAIPKSKNYNHILKYKGRYDYDLKYDVGVRAYAEYVSKIKIPKSFSYDEIMVVFKECSKYDIPPGLIFRLISAESSFKRKAKSHVGASGYMQLMPRTYKHFRDKLNLNEKEEHSNLKVGIYYVNHLYKKWKGYNKKTRWKMTLLSYNYGITKVKNNVTYFQSPKFDSYWYIKKIIG